MPMPQLKVRSISFCAMPPSLASHLNTGSTGTATNVPVNTAKTRFQRAKRMLRPLLLARHAGVAWPSGTADGTGPARPAGKEGRNGDAS